MSSLSIGIDVGGTFTDLVAIDDGGIVTTAKVLSTPADHGEGVDRSLLRLGAAPAAVRRLVHGTTIATNTLLERSGANVVLCATAGAVDLLELRRQDRAALYDLSRQHLPPLVDRHRTVAVAERVEPGGIVRALTSARAVAETVAGLAPEVVAIALLHAYADASHERELAAAISACLPDIDVVLSSETLPEIREYERAATTAAEAYLRPRVAGYLRRLTSRLSAAGLPAPSVMMSSGGVRGADDAAGHAAALALSGPAGGVVGAAIAAAAAAIDRALTIDIGGTSADVGLILDGQPLVEAGGSVAGVPIALPRVLVETVSAGGGSMAWIDDGGALRVGPRSAGAVPGPVAFGRGGLEPTVTDAHVVLGHIGAAGLGGEIALDAEAACAAVRRLGTRLATTTGRTARAIIATADAAMARALRRVSVERGVDPRGCALVAFGGGGPLHGCGLAEQLGIGQVLIPPYAGVLSALGLASTPERREAMQSVMRRAAELEPGDVSAITTSLGARAASPSLPAPSLEWWAHARYEGQGHEIDVPIGRGDGGRDIAARFAELHGARYGFTLEREVEIVSARVAASGPPCAVMLARRGRATWRADRLVDDGSELEVTLPGPASVALPDATLLVPSRWTARALPVGGWLVERDA